MSKLFQPLDLAGCRLQHRLVMAPMTRFRADDDYVPMDIMKDYYEQRASVPGTLLISEGVQVSKRCLGMKNVPGIWSPEQVAAWRKITDAVHAKGSYIWCQLWVLGRASVPALRQELGLKLLSSSAVAGSPDGPVPVEMTEEEIREVMDDYRAAAKNALEAGFDGVQLHGANGYLPDQFLQDVCNKRTDRWGGSIENRARFHIEAARTIAEVVGPSRTGVRLSPWSDFNSMGMEDPVPTFTYLIKELRAMNIAALDLVEARIRGNDDADCGAGRDNTVLVQAWGKDAPVTLGGGLTPETARKTVDEIYKDYNVAVLFGRPWTSNPDLPFRVKEDVPLVKYDRSTFYVAKSSKGYNDWDFSKEFTASSNAATGAA